MLYGELMKDICREMQIDRNALPDKLTSTLLKEMCRVQGVDVKSLPDNLYSTMLIAVMEKMGIDCDNLPDRLYGTCLNNLWQVCQCVLPDVYQQVEYLESTGTQFITTDLVLSNLSAVEYRFRLPEVQTGSRYLFGAQAGTSSGRFGLAKSSSGVFSGMYATSGGVGVTDALAADTEWHTSIMDGANAIYSVDGVEYGPAPASGSVFSTNYTARLFGCANATQGAAVVVGYCKIWENGELVGHFIPCYRKADDVNGMYDLVSGQFYTNAGTGDFLRG